MGTFYTRTALSQSYHQNMANFSREQLASMPMPSFLLGLKCFPEKFLSWLSSEVSRQEVKGMIGEFREIAWKQRKGKEECGRERETESMCVCV